MLAVYFIILSIICLLGIHRFILSLLYLKHRNNIPQPKSIQQGNITVQLPIFNERNVVEQLLQSVCSFQWSHGDLEIQVLDDSTDETQNILQRIVKRYQAQGIQIQYIHRKDRIGYKAGALAQGLKTAKGDFIAVFDADFTPHPDFLEKSMGYFTDKNIGMIQTRWEHQNREQNLLTQLTSILLDGHFVVEHTTRHRTGRFFNFNGTAGIWRRSCIEDAGGWQHDTITEDLDLSYRAQLRGWQFTYLQDITAPAEIPDHISAFATQQFRWAKGTTQTAIKLIKKIWFAPISFWTKLEASFHLLGNIGYPLTLCLTLLMPFSAFLRFEKYQGELILATLDFSLFIFSCIGVLFFYGLSQKEIKRLKNIRSFFLLILALGLGVGLAFQQTKAILQGIQNQDQVFIRTPKKGTRQFKRYSLGNSPKGMVEILLGIYCLGSIFWLLNHGVLYSIPFLCLFAFGYSYVGFGFLLPQIKSSQDLSSQKLPSNPAKVRLHE